MAATGICRGGTAPAARLPRCSARTLSNPLLGHHCCVVFAVADTRLAAAAPQNKRTHGSLPNTSFEAADVMTMAFDGGSYDFVFTNWLFMYLSDAELALLAPRLLRCLTPGGRLFFRESCNRQSGDRSRAFNPSRYRAASQYTELFEGTTLPCGARFRLESSGCVPPMHAPSDCTRFG